MLRIGRVGQVDGFLGGIAGGLGAHLRACASILPSEISSRDLVVMAGGGLATTKSPSDLSNDRHERQRVWAETAGPHVL